MMNLLILDGMITHDFRQMASLFILCVIMINEEWFGDG